MEYQKMKYLLFTKQIMKLRKKNYFQKLEKDKLEF